MPHMSPKASPCLTPERFLEAACSQEPILNADELRHLLRCKACLDTFAELEIPKPTLAQLRHDTDTTP